MTYGQELVRVSFNPSADSVVDQIKQKTAELIDLIDNLGPTRTTCIAITRYEEAAMWAVKAATAK